jgi:hypothetical protein
VSSSFGRLWTLLSTQDPCSSFAWANRNGAGSSGKAPLRREAPFSWPATEAEMGVLEPP